MGQNGGEERWGRGWSFERDVGVGGWTVHLGNTGSFFAS